jgi:hypothetical protein
MRRASLTRMSQNSWKIDSVSATAPATPPDQPAADGDRKEQTREHVSYPASNACRMTSQSALPRQSGNNEEFDSRSPNSWSSTIDHRDRRSPPETSHTEGLTRKLRDAMRNGYWGSSVQVRSGAPARMLPPTAHAVSRDTDNILRIILTQPPPLLLFLRSSDFV